MPASGKFVASLRIFFHHNRWPAPVGVVVMAQKTCFKCNQSKPRSEFYKHSQMGDGLLGKCKTCAKADVQKRYEQKRQDIAVYEKNRNQTPARRANKIAYQITGRARHPQKYKARTALNNAIRDKRIAKKPCEVCGNVESEGHHDDYSQPLVVRWLCFFHHRKAHGQNPF